MALIQQTFLDASIRGFDGSIGWGTQASTVSVALVDDPENGDSFNPPSIGTAVTFNYDQWQFSGILQGYKRDYGQQGNPVYNVQIQDPRELLSGVQLILQDYTGSTMGVPNIYNIYGYLEALRGFGGSQSNDSGLPWYLIRDTFYQLQLTSPIYFRGAYYILDPFIGLPLLPSYYRVGGDSISALDFIMDICDAISCDFFIDMIPLDNDETPATNVIKVRLVSRNYPLRNDAINDFVEQTDGAVAKSAGYELSNEVTSKFVVGGKVNNLYFQDQAYTTPYNETLYDDVIVPFWGYNAWGQLAIGYGDFNGSTGHEYRVTIDGRPLVMAVGAGAQNLMNYTLDLAELHAARAGQESWESFLWFYDKDINSIHYNKATTLGLTTGKLSDEFMKWLGEWKTGRFTEGRSGGPDLPSSRVISKKKAELVNANYGNEETRKRINKAFAFINKYATEYYGKKFMVRVPFVAGAWIPETNQLRFSLTPTSTGYVEESYWGIAAYNGYMPYNPDKFTSDDNRIYPYARFSGQSQTSYTRDDGVVVSTDLRSKYGLDKMSLDSYILDQYPNQKLGNMRENLFVKCSIEEKLVFLNPATLFSPRAVVTLSGPVPDSVRNKELYNTALIEEIKTWVKEGEPEDAEVETWAKKFGGMFGNDSLWKSKDANFNMPDMVAVPLESQTLRYGPWYISNTAGRVDFENDSSLVPWSFGSFTAMNLAGWAKVENALTSQQVHEMGSVEYPGVPTLSLGSALLSSGPTVTDINVTVGQDGVTTTYRMATWVYQFGRLGKYNVERFARLSKVAKEQRKAFRKFYGYKAPLNYFKAEEGKAGVEDVDKKEPKSSDVVGGGMTRRGEGDDVTVTPSVSTMPTSKLTKTLDDDTYSDKGAVSMDGLYVPFTTNPDGVSSDLPHFETPVDDATEPTVDDLNPYGTNTTGMVLPYSDGLPDDIDAVADGDHVNSMAFRTPLILGGWGRDTSNNPVPSGGDGEYITNYKQRADLWKVGPLDVRWDDSRKLWNASGGGGGGTEIGTVLTTIGYGGSGSVGLLGYDASVDADGVKPFSSQGGTVTAYEHVLAVGDLLYYGTKVVLTQSNGVYVIIGILETCRS